jgi:hypothetical protein
MLSIVSITPLIAALRKRSYEERIWLQPRRIAIGTAVHASEPSSYTVNLLVT